MTFFLVTLAEASLKAGMPQEGMVALDEAEKLVTQLSEHYYEAEVYRVRGELRFALSAQDQTVAIADIERAIAIAREQQARSLELRATTSLYRLAHSRSSSMEKRQLLYKIYRSFSEGFGTTDLEVARTALEVTSEARTKPHLSER